MICECDCETDGSIIEDSDKCEGAGDLICGSCQCHKGSYGEKCEVRVITNV